MKKTSLAIVIVLIIPLVTLSVKYNKLSKSYNMQSFVINMNFKSSLSQAISGFSADLKNSTDESYRESNYNRAMSSLASARVLIVSTDYDEQNERLRDALDNLYRLMESGKHKKYIAENSVLINDNLKKLAANLLDTEAAENIMKITQEAQEDK